MLHKTTKETESTIDYNKLLRTENKVDRLIRKKKEIENMNPREKIEMEIISTDPINYTNVMTENQKIELHRVNDAFVRPERRSRRNQGPRDHFNSKNLGLNTTQ